MAALYERVSLQAHEIRFVPGRVNDKWMQIHRHRLSRLSNLSLTLRKTAVTDEGISQILGMKNVRALDLMGTPLTESSIETISTLRQLSTLNVARTGIAGSSLAKLAPRGLTWIGIDSNQLTNGGMQFISGMTSPVGIGIFDADDATVSPLLQQTAVMHLLLQGEGITNESLPNLMKLATVKYLMLLDTNLSDAEIVQLQQALPNCQINKMTSEQLERVMHQSTQVSSNQWTW